MIKSNDKKYMAKEEINALPLFKFTKKIIVINHEEQLKKALDELSQKTLLGLDTESKPTFKKGDWNPVSLLQLATDVNVYLFRLNKIGLPLELVTLLENKTIIKAGVAINNDLLELKKLRPFKEAGFIELHDLSAKKKIKNQGIRGLAAILLGTRISKAAKLSNWENKKLTKAQLIYAATDAWIGRELYLKMI